MVVERAEQAAGAGGDLFDQGFAKAVRVTRGQGFAGAKLKVGRNGHEGELEAL